MSCARYYDCQVEGKHTVVKGNASQQVCIQIVAPNVMASHRHPKSSPVLFKMPTFFHQKKMCKTVSTISKVGPIGISAGDTIVPEYVPGGVCVWRG